MDTRKFLDLFEREKKKKKVDKSDWDMDYIIDNVMDLVEEYEFDWDKEVLIPEDDALFADMFKAARELLIRTGIYNMTTGRIMQLSPEEIDEGLRNMKTELTMGEGKDAYTLVARKVEDERPPAIWAGNPGCPTPERLYYPIVESVAKEPVIDLLTCGSLVDVDGYGVQNGEPSEIFAVRREMEYLHRALEKVGRPGMGLLAAESAVTEVGDLAAVAERWLRPCDSHLVALFNELIMDNGNLVRTANSLDYGMKNASLACTMVGGLGGDAPGSCMIMIASIMAANLFAAPESGVRTILAVYIPSTRAFMHLDTVFTQVDVDKYTVHPAILGPLKIFEITRGDHFDPSDPEPELNIYQLEEPLEQVLARYLHRDSVRLIPCGGNDPIAAAREQWNDGSNTLCLSPGKIIVYSRNELSNELLRQEGLEVLEIPSSELSRGRGGPRCMSMPLTRDINY